MREQVPEGVGGRIRRVPVHARSRVVVREQEKPEAEGLALAGRQPPARRRGQREREAEEGGRRVGEARVLFVWEQFRGATRQPHSQHQQASTANLWRHIERES